jgi:glycosyltransferase involved in cell wall biosynthesis
LHTLVEAVPLVLSECPQARFVIAGRGSQLASLRQRVQEMGLGSAVRFPGFISDAERDRLYAVSDAAMFPSLYEPFGIVALEAMAARCPVIVSAVGGLHEIVRCCETGLTVYPEDPASLSWGILKVLAEPERAQEWAAAAYRMVRQDYNWDRIAELTVSAYHRARKGSV